MVFIQRDQKKEDNIFRDRLSSWGVLVKLQEDKTTFNLRGQESHPLDSRKRRGNLNRRSDNLTPDFIVVVDDAATVSYYLAVGHRVLLLLGVL